MYMYIYIFMYMYMYMYMYICIYIYMYSMYSMSLYGCGWKKVRDDACPDLLSSSLNHNPSTCDHVLTRYAARTSKEVQESHFQHINHWISGLA